MLNLLFLIFFILLCVCSLFGWQYVLQQSQVLDLASGKLSPINPLGLTDVVIMFLTWIAGQMTSAGILHVGGISMSTADQSALPTIIGISAFSQLVFTAIGLGLIVIRHQPLRVVSFGCSHWRESVRLGAFAFVLAIPPLLILQWTLTYFVDYSHDSLKALEENPNATALGLVWFGAVISAPISEEIFFRGILLRWLQRITSSATSVDRLISGGVDYAVPPASLNGQDLLVQAGRAAKDADSSNPVKFPPTAMVEVEESQTPTRGSAGSLSTALVPICVSSLVFAAVHIGQGLAPIPLFYLGLVLGYLYFKTGHLLPCIVLHLGLNAYSMFWFTLGAFTDSTAS
jgi:membrane protease YdiL (CAAX protease family)